MPTLIDDGKPDAPPGSHWQHKKCGYLYEVITDCASLQCSAAPHFESMFDDDNWTVYRNIKTGTIWIRPTPEFLDGRFERAADEA